MSPSSQRGGRPPREVVPLSVEPLMAAWIEGDVVRATLRHIGEMPIIALGGPLDGTAVQPCREALNAVLRSRPRRLVVDLAAVTSSDDTCVAILADLRRRATWHGTQLWLAAVPEHVRVALERAGVLSLYPTERNAERVVDILRLRQTHLRHRTA